MLVPEQIGSHRKLDLSRAPKSLPRVFVSPRQPYTGPSQPLSLSSFYCPCDSASMQERREEGREEVERGRETDTCTIHIKFGNFKKFQ